MNTMGEWIERADSITKNFKYYTLDRRLEAIYMELIS